MASRVVPEPAGPDQESVWAYPRPAVAEPTARHLKVVFAGRTIAETTSGFRTLETSHPPTYYFPPDDVVTSFLRPTAGESVCEWKGTARYFDVVVGDRAATRSAWAYPNPTAPFRRIRNHIAFYPTAMDSCWVDGEEARPQDGGFYGGWITSHVTGPFKGAPGTMMW